jgi:hypothetical protein
MATTYDLLGSAVSDGTVTALTVSAIPQTYDDLVVFMTGYSLGSSGSTTGIMRFNNSSATIYDMQNMLLIDNSNQNDAETVAATAYTVISWPSNTASTFTEWGYLQIDVPKYTKANFGTDKHTAMTVQYLNNRDSQTTDGATGLAGWGLELDAAITEVNWVGHYDGGNVNNGGSLKVYGIKNS